GGRIWRGSGAIVRHMGDGSSRAGLDVSLPRPGAVSQPGRPRLVWARWLEALGVMLSPPAAALVLRLRLMSSSVSPDPALHTSFIVEGRDVFMRYSALAGGGLLRGGGGGGCFVRGRGGELGCGAGAGVFVSRCMVAA